MAVATLQAQVPAPARAVFATLVDPAALPTWNTAIRAVVEAPATLAPGDEWVVDLGALGTHWHSRSRVVELDPEAGVFAYRSGTDDGNPSYSDWRWTVTPAGDGCHVTVTWDLHPVTFWRRVLLGRIRARQLRSGELPASVQALGRLAAERA